MKNGKHKSRRNRLCVVVLFIMVFAGVVAGLAFLVHHLDRQEAQSNLELIQAETDSTAVPDYKNSDESTEGQDAYMDTHISGTFGVNGVLVWISSIASQCEGYE